MLLFLNNIHISQERHRRIKRHYFQNKENTGKWQKMVTYYTITIYNAFSRRYAIVFTRNRKYITSRCSQKFGSYTPT